MIAPRAPADRAAKWPSRCCVSRRSRAALRMLTGCRVARHQPDPATTGTASHPGERLLIHISATADTDGIGPAERAISPGRDHAEDRPADPALAAQNSPICAIRALAALSRRPPMSGGYGSLVPSGCGKTCDRRHRRCGRCGDVSATTSRVSGPAGSRRRAERLPGTSPSLRPRREQRRHGCGAGDN